MIFQHVPLLPGDAVLARLRAVFDERDSVQFLASRDGMCMVEDCRKGTLGTGLHRHEFTQRPHASGSISIPKLICHVLKGMPTFVFLTACNMTRKVSPLLDVLHLKLFIPLH